MSRQDVDVTLPWMGAGTEFVVRIVETLPDDAFAAPSALPGWTRAHVVAHLARNAEALTRLATWARTGVETPMYTDAAQRERDIEASAKYPAETLRHELVTTADDLDTAVAALDDAAWQARVRSAQGRSIPAADIPWMRVREVWLHAVDLDAGASVDDLPDGVIDTLLDDVTAALTEKDGCPAARLAPVDRDRVWALGPDGLEIRGALEIKGSAADVLAWLVGRADGAGLTAAAPLPVPPRWI